MLSPDLISGITFWVFKSLWESRDETYKVLSERLKQIIFYASKEYQANYISRHGFVEQEDFRPSVELARIYVSPSLIDQIMPIHPLAKKVIPHQEIDYLKGLNLLWDGVELATKYKHLIIRGETGIGKTTLLKKIGIEAFNTGNHNLINAHIPVFIQTADCPNGEFDLQVLIEKEFEVCGFPEHQAFVDSALKKGKLLILVDDLDIIAIDRRDHIMLKIKDFADLYKANRIILVGRKSKRPHPLPHFHTVNLLGFSSTQAQSYINRIHQVQYEEKLPQAICQNIWNQISERNKATKLIVYNPYYLSIVLSLYQASRDKISSTTALYEKILSNFLTGNGYIDSCQSTSRPMDARLKILAEIAYVCLKSGRSSFHKAEIYKLYATIQKRQKISDNSANFSLQREEHLADFIVYVDKNLCQFDNFLLQKLLVAHHLMRSFKALDESIDQFLDVHAWQDVFIFLSGMQGADHLISLLQNSVLKKVNSPHLTQFTAWISQVSEQVSISANETANRCHVIFMVFEIMLIFGDRTPDRIVISNILKQLKEIFSLLDPESPILGLKKLHSQIERRSRSTHFIDPNVMRGLSTEGLLDLANILAQRASSDSLIGIENVKRLTTIIQHLRHKLSGKAMSTYHRKVCKKNLYRLWVKSLGITEGDLDFTARDLQSFYLYCRGIHLIIQCINEAFFVSGRLQKDVIQTLFKPVAQVKPLIVVPPLSTTL